MRPNEKAIEMEFWVMLRISEMQFASAADLAGLGEYSMSQCRKTLDMLERRGDASCSQLGATARKLQHYLLTGQGVQKVKDKCGDSPGWYVVEPGAKDLALRFRMVEQFYRILPKLRAAAGYQAAGDRGLLAANPRLHRFIWLPTRLLPRHRRIRKWSVVRAHPCRDLVHCRGDQTEVGRPPQGRPGPPTLDRMGHG